MANNILASRTGRPHGNDFLQVIDRQNAYTTIVAHTNSLSHFPPTAPAHGSAGLSFAQHLYSSGRHPQSNVSQNPSIANPLPRRGPVHLVAIPRSFTDSYVISKRTQSHQPAPQPLVQRATTLRPPAITSFPISHPQKAYPSPPPSSTASSTTYVDSPPYTRMPTPTGHASRLHHQQPSYNLPAGTPSPPPTSYLPTPTTPYFRTLPQDPIPYAPRASSEPTSTHGTARGTAHGKTSRGICKKLMLGVAGSVVGLAGAAGLDAVIDDNGDGDSGGLFGLADSFQNFSMDDGGNSSDSGYSSGGTDQFGGSGDNGDSFGQFGDDNDDDQFGGTGGGSYDQFGDNSAAGDQQDPYAFNPQTPSYDDGAYDQGASPQYDGGGSYDQFGNNNAAGDQQDPYAFNPPTPDSAYNQDASPQYNDSGYQQYSDGYQQYPDTSNGNQQYPDTSYGNQQYPDTSDGYQQGTQQQNQNDNDQGSGWQSQQSSDQQEPNHHYHHHHHHHQQYQQHQQQSDYAANPSSQAYANQGTHSQHNHHHAHQAHGNNGSNPGFSTPGSPNANQPHPHVHSPHHANTYPLVGSPNHGTHLVHAQHHQSTAHASHAHASPARPHHAAEPKDQDTGISAQKIVQYAKTAASVAGVAVKIFQAAETLTGNNNTGSNNVFF
jgi:hypothetical protein